ncbi:MAG: Gfo/Idh/MocA family oxidoreductase, partial [Flavisolibacter sp.]|nr:Gfo/Idh/MocA family oxidoreductase [Flavisolibacter sp.]
MTAKKTIHRREFISTAATASLAFTIVPRNVLGGPGFIAPSDKINLAYIGCGTQGLREMCELLPNPELQIVSVCDPNKMSTNYVDWSPNGIRNSIRKALEEPTWGENLNGIPGGRDIGKELVEKYYSKKSDSKNYKGCTSYADFRELLEKEKDIDAVKIMTPDHLHGYISIAAMKKGKHVVIHKPIANRMYEARLVMD